MLMEKEKKKFSDNAENNNVIATTDN